MSSCVFKKKIIWKSNYFHIPIHLSIMSRPVTNGAILTTFFPLATVKIDSPSCANPMLLNIDRHGAYFATFSKKKILLSKYHHAIAFLPTPLHTNLGSNDLIIQLDCSKLHFKRIPYDIGHQTSQYPRCIICHSHPRCTFLIPS